MLFDHYRRSDYNRGQHGGRNVPSNFPNRREEVADKLVNQLQGLVSALTYVSIASSRLATAVVYMRLAISQAVMSEL